MVTNLASMTNASKYSRPSSLTIGQKNKHAKQNIIIIIKI